MHWQGRYTNDDVIISSVVAVLNSINKILAIRELESKQVD